MAMVNGIDKLVKVEGFDLNNLKAVIKALNGAEILKSAVKTVGIKKEVIVDSFMKAIESVPQGSDEEKKIPAEAIKLYNDFVDIIEDRKVGLDSVAPAKKEEKEKVKEEKKQKLEKEGVDRSIFGKHQLGSQGAIIDAALSSADTIDEVAKKAGVPATRVHGHIAFLKKKRGLKISVVGGKISIHS